MAMQLACMHTFQEAAVPIHELLSTSWNMYAHHLQRCKSLHLYKWRAYIEQSALSIAVGTLASAQNAALSLCNW